ncbi:MAG: hypothetical protein K9M57_05945, partial [Phycisphaerae bacterium]|nr:hypothetical protein [Phycisphaerae bacterium]
MNETKKNIRLMLLLGMGAFVAFSSTVMATSDIFSVNFYAYGGLTPADHEAVTLEAGESAGFGSWNTLGWNNIEVPWAPTSPQAPQPITSFRGAIATFTLNDSRNGGPYGW